MDWTEFDNLDLILEDESFSVLRSTLSSPQATVISFASMGVINDKTPYEFARSLKKFPVNLILVRDPNIRWYQGPISGLGKTPQDMAVRLRHFVDQLGAPQLVTMGSSMGGYAALLFGGLLNANRTLSFAPQVLLRPEDRKLLADRRWMPEQNAIKHCHHPDLLPILQQAPNLKAIVCIGLDEWMDLLHLSHISSCQCVHSWGVKDAVHEVAMSLKKKNLLSHFIEYAALGNEESTATLTQAEELVALDTSPFLKSLTGYTECVLQNGQPLSDTITKNIITDILKQEPDWAGGWYQLASFARGDRDYDKAIPYYEKALQYAEDRKTLYWIKTILGGIYMQRGDYDRATDLIEESVLSAPKAPGPAISKLELLYKKGELENADKWASELLERGIPLPAKALILRCQIYTGLKEESKAEAVFAQLQQEFPEHPMLPIISEQIARLSPA